MGFTYPNKISWHLLSEGINYYQKQDFEYREVPWIASESSEEKSFLYLDSDGGLPPGKYMTVLPCFNMDNEDELHRRQFMKLDLYITNDVTLDNLQNVIRTCQEFFKKYIWKWPIEKVKQDDTTFKLISHGIELGSYGLRERGDFKWIYATGMAEPRLSQVRVMSIRNK
jgi:hypothetical protein